MKTKKLISKYLAALWLVSLLGFLGLQANAELAKGTKFKEKNPDIQELVLVASQHSQATGFAPDLKLLPAFLLPHSVDFYSTRTIGIPIGNSIHCLVKKELFQFLKSSISINAP
jgi:hypothetical protein